MSLHVVHLGQCSSTQDEVRSRLADAGPGTVVAVSTESQLAGRGRAGRTWHDPPEDALMLSVGAGGPLPVGVLDDLPRRVADCVLDVIGARGGRPDTITWKAPNDLVAAADGAKLAGILVDARTTGDEVGEVVVGIGLNLGSGRFTTPDGRAAVGLAALVDHAPDRSALGRALARGVAGLLAT